jgi:methionyl-tRNA formyltransferase
MPRFRIVFFGTPAFAVLSLRALLDGPDTVVGVVCQPDRPAGRGQRVHVPPVKELACARGVPVAQPEKVRTAEFLDTLRAWSPELIAVAAYGRILPRAVLDVPRLGCINVHASLLPRYRGAAPIQWAIMHGEVVTGVTIMQMNERMDEGDILMQREVWIGPQETGGELQERLAAVGAEALMEALEALHGGTLRPRPQDHQAATLAPVIKKENGRVDWARPAEEIARQVRAFNPWPSAFSTLQGKLVKIHQACALPFGVFDAPRNRPSTGSGRAESHHEIKNKTGRAEPVEAPFASLSTLSDSEEQAPGTVVAVDDTICVATGGGTLAIEELQLEGRKRLRAADFARSGAVAVGVRFGSDGPTG